MNGACPFASASGGQVALSVAPHAAPAHPPQRMDNGLVSSPAPDFEFGTDGPSLILVGVDGSRTSLRAAAYAGGLARRQRCRLLAVYVGRVPATAGAAPGGALVMNETFEQIADELKQLMLGRAAETGIAAEFRSVCGDPLAELTRIAEETRPTPWSSARPSTWATG